jgi:hypothetical protein
VQLSHNKVDITYDIHRLHNYNVVTAALCPEHHHLETAFVRACCAQLHACMLHTALPTSCTMCAQPSADHSSGRNCVYQLAETCSRHCQSLPDRQQRRRILVTAASCLQQRAMLDGDKL